MKKNKRKSNRRGTAMLIVVVLLVVGSVMLANVVESGARDSNIAANRLATVRAFYAAEGGMNMAIYELMNNNDDDGDGGIGTISDNDDTSDDPALGSARVFVTSQTSGITTTLISSGRSGNTTRVINVDIE